MANNILLKEINQIIEGYPEYNSSTITVDQY